MLGAELVEEVAAADAEFCFEGVGGVVEACVDDLVAIEGIVRSDRSGLEGRGPHLGVAAARLGSWGIVSLEENGRGAFARC